MTDRRTEVDGQPSGPDQTLRYLDLGEVGSWFGVTQTTVSTWRSRYAETHPFPEPDVIVGRTPGWARGRRDEIERWERGRPGRGAGGGRPRKGDTGKSRD